MMITTMLGLAAGQSESLTVQAVARGPHTAAPPTFEGHGWLVVLNLTVFTGGFLLLSMLVGWLVEQMLRYRHVDRWHDPVSVYRRIGMFWAAGFAIRCFSEAYSIWAWDPFDPAATAMALQAKRFLDPVGFSIAMIGVAQYALSVRGMVPHMRKLPFPLNMWASLPMLKRPAMVVVLTLIAAICVTATR